MSKRAHWIENYHYLFKRVRTKIYTWMLSPCLYSMGEKSSIIPPLRFANLQYVELGKYVTIHSHCWINVLADTDDTDAPKLIIRDHVGIGMNATITVAKKVVIGEHVFTGRNVFISDHAHDYRETGVPIYMQGVYNLSGVTIGAHSWLGHNSSVLPGVTIGKHCVIGANSIVNRDIPDYHVAAGVPAIPVRFYDISAHCWKRLK